MSKTGISSTSGLTFKLFMIRHLLIFLCIVTLSAQSSFSFSSSDDDKLRANVRDKGEAEVVISRPGPAEMELLSRNTSIASVKGTRVYIILSPHTLDWFLSKGYAYTIVERDEAKGITMASDFNKALEWNTYPTYSQYDSIMRSFAISYPGLCTLDTIGSSVLGRLLLTLKITGIANGSQPKPAVFYSSTIHGNETGGFILMLRLCSYLLQNYGTSTDVTDLLDNLEIWINPLANPDGTYRDGNDIINPTRTNANGYDLNRNFPDPEVSGNVLQKETREMTIFLAKHRFCLSANFHSGSEVANYPWDRWARDHADVDWFYRICRSYADTAHLYSRKGYMTFLDNGVTDGYSWYQVFGGRQDYVTWALHGREITVELDTNYITPTADLQSLWEANRRSLIGYLENALYGIHGRVRDSFSGNPVPAKITIAAHDKDNSEVYSDTASGNFVRLISPGSWNLTFSAEGYRDTVIQNVAVTDRGITSLDVRMEPVNRLPDAGSADIFLYPNPADKQINALLSEKLKSEVTVRVFNTGGMVVMTFDTNLSSNIPLIIDTGNLASGSYIVQVRNKSTGFTANARFTKISNR